LPAASLLDRPLARIIAGFCFIASIGALAYLHRDDLFPPTAAANQALADCNAKQSAQIDAMLRDKLIVAAKAALFRQRAQARCAATHGTSQ
jgi:hypothetical protein